MKYSKKALWKAIGVFCPGFIEAKANGVRLEAPECLRTAIKDAFMLMFQAKYETVEGHRQMTWEELGACAILYDAQLALSTNGQFDYGDDDGNTFFKD